MKRLLVLCLFGLGCSSTDKRARWEGEIEAKTQFDPRDQSLDKFEASVSLKYKL